MGVVKTKKRAKKQIKTSPYYIKTAQITEHVVRTAVIILFILLSTSIILYARGYRVDVLNRKLSPTGILAISSNPKAAKVFVNGEFKGVTDLNLSLTPGSYTIDIKKDGFIPFSKTLVLRGELVEAIDPILFPQNPSLSPLTNLGISKAVEIDSSNKVLVMSETGDPEKDGVYVFEASQTPINIFPPLKKLALKSTLLQAGNLKDASIIFSDDMKQAIVSLPMNEWESVSYLLSLDQENQVPLNVTESRQTIISAWDKERVKEMTKLLETYPKEFRKIATDSMEMIKYSPDRTKVLYRAKKGVNLPIVITPPLIAANQTEESRHLTEGAVYVYDRKEDKNYQIGNEQLDVDTVRWYTDSKHLVLNENHQFVMSLYDGTGKQTLYSGPITPGFFTVTTSGQLLILANLNPQLNALPDIYEVGIR